MLAETPQFTESRKVSLYSNFGRLAQTNPDGFDANVKAWKNVLLQCLKRGYFDDKCAIPAGQPLLESLSDKKWGVPLALNSVFDEMIREKQLIPATIFLESSVAVTTTSWRPWNITKAGISWIASRFIDLNWHSGELGVLKPDKYIAVDRLASISESLLMRLRAEMNSQGNSWCSRVFFAEDCHKLYPGLSDLDLQCCLIYLSRERGILGYNRKENIISFSGSVTEDEKFLMSVRKQLRELNARHAALERQIATVGEEAKTYITKDKNRTRRLFRSRATLERSAKHVLHLVEQLEAVLQKLDESHDNARSVEALRQSNKLLAKSTAQIEIESVDKLIDELQENFSLADEVTGAVDELNLRSNEEEIETELGEIEREAAANEQLSSMPNAPTNALSTDQNVEVKGPLLTKKKAAPLTS